jgi:hypothetical protein
MWGIIRNQNKVNVTKLMKGEWGAEKYNKRSSLRKKKKIVGVRKEYRG